MDSVRESSSSRGAGGGGGDSADEATVPLKTEAAGLGRMGAMSQWAGFVQATYQLNAFNFHHNHELYCSNLRYTRL